MNYNSNRDLHLPDHFSDDLQRMDTRMWQIAQTAEPPAGLTRRVFEASVSELPAPRLRLAGRRTTANRSAGAAPVWTTRFAGGMRLAAAIALSLVAGLYVLSTQQQTSTPGASNTDSIHAARSTETTAIQDNRPTDNNDAFDMEEEWLRVLLASADHSSQEAMYLIDTHDATYDDVQSQLNQILESTSEM